MDLEEKLEYKLGQREGRIREKFFPLELPHNGNQVSEFLPEKFQVRILFPHHTLDNYLLILARFEGCNPDHARKHLFQLSFNFSPL